MAVIPTNLVIRIRCREPNCRVIYGQGVYRVTNLARVFEEPCVCGACGGRADVVAVTAGNVAVDFEKTRAAYQDEDEIQSVLG
jgi:hypothetical protein